VSFEVRAGEILGVAGVQGNGQTELCEALMGLLPAAAGTVTLNGRDLTRETPRARLRAGIAYVPEDRTQDGLVGSFSVSDNLVLDMYDRKPFASGINRNLSEIARNAAARIEEFDVRTGSPATPAGTLSGGNQQKVILAREVGREHKLLIASQPTRGIDVGSIEFVHRRIVEQRDHGVAVLIVSSELDEIYALADRIAVMYEGKIAGFRDPDVPAAELGRLMAGGADAGSVPDAEIEPGALPGPDAIAGSAQDPGPATEVAAPDVAAPEPPASQEEA
jgi:simple sugar transport system ATP-binding protein